MSFSERQVFDMQKRRMTAIQRRKEGGRGSRNEDEVRYWKAALRIRGLCVKRRDRFVQFLPW